MSFQKATRGQRVVHALLQGPSGSGKTLSSLKLMKGITNNGKIAVIDTENSRSAIYANDFDFFIKVLSPTEQNVSGYIAAMEEAKSKCEGLIVDGISPAWKDLLEKHMKLGGKYSDWGPITPIQDKFLNYILNYPIPIICTARSKQTFVQEQDEKGKTQIRKVGMEAVQRNDIDYEFDVAFKIDRDSHMASLLKNNYREIEEYMEQNNGEVLLTEEVGELIRKIIKG